MLKFLWYCVIAVVGGVVILIGLYLPGAYTEFAFWLPFLLSFFAFGGALLVINDGKLGSISFRRMWEVLRAMGPIIQVGLALGFLTVFMYQPDTDDDLGFKQIYVTMGVWFATVGTALVYGEWARRRGGEPPDDAQRQAGRVVIGVVWGVALLGVLRALWLN